MAGEIPQIIPHTEETPNPISVFVADDEKTPRRTVIAAIKRASRSMHLTLNTTAFSCAEDLLDKIEAGKKPDLVITDGNMHALSGLDMAGMLNDRWPEIPVGFFSGNEGMVQRARTNKHPNIAETVLKPYSINSLVPVIKRLVLNIINQRNMAATEADTEIVPIINPPEEIAEAETIEMLHPEKAAAADRRKNTLETIKIA